MADPTYEQLLARFSALSASAVPFDGVVYRSSTPRFATGSDLLTGNGSRSRGGRWNPIGVATVYSTLAPETAMAESLAHSRYYGERIEDSMPRTFVAIRVRLQKVLDLRDAKVRRRLQVSIAKLLQIDWRQEMYASREPITQRVGRAAHSLGWEALIVTSAADPTGHNLLCFPDCLLTGSGMTILNAVGL